MALFTSFGRRRTITGGEAPGRELPEDVRRSLPPRFEAVGEALASATDARPACAVVGRDVARDGAALGEALDGLRTTFDLVVGLDPDFAAVEALSVAWSEATLEFLHDLSCEDPLTGMASFAHVRTRLDEVYREHGAVGSSAPAQHALVVIEMSPAARHRRADHQFTRALHLVQVTEAMRAVFPGGETIGRIGTDRATAVVRRTAQLGGSVALLRELLGDLDLGATAVRVWIEGLPSTAESAARLLDDLARS
jgi:GGDEF domain-containing protein